MKTQTLKKVKIGSSLFSVLAIGFMLPSQSLAGHDEDSCSNSPRVMEAAHQLDVTADRFHETIHRLTGSGSLAEAAHDLSEAAEHLHEVVEQGADCDHIRDDFANVDAAFTRVRNEWHFTNYFIRRQPEVKFAFRSMEHAFYDLRQAVNSYNPGPWIPPQPPVPPTREINIRCKSTEFQYNVCGVGSVGSVVDVNVVSRKSNAPCNKAQFGSRMGSFGITNDRTSVWVDRGCEAIFSVLVR